jgi:tyrosine-protein kinase Etk/Wzc
LERLTNMPSTETQTLTENTAVCTTVDNGTLPDEPGFSRGVTLMEMLTQLACRKRLIAEVTGAAILVGVLLSFVLPVRYTASTEILPPRQTQSAADLFLGQIANSNLGSLASMAGGGLGLKSPNDLYIGLLKSRPVADAIIRQFDLERVYRSRDMTAARQQLAENTTVESEKSGLISVSITDKSKQRAAEMANAYTEQLRVLTQTLAVTEASQRRLFYEEQLRRAKDDLVQAEAVFQQVEQKKGLVQPDAQARALIGNLASLRAQVAAKQVQVQALRSYSTERNPDVQLAENQLSSLQTEVSRLEQRDPVSGPSDTSIEEVPAAGLEYLSAEHELLYRQTLFDLLVKQYDAARLDEAKEAAVIQVVETAIPPDRKSSPRRGLIVGLFSIGGFFAACMVALMQFWHQFLQSDPNLVGQLEALRYALTWRGAQRA